MKDKLKTYAKKVIDNAAAMPFIVGLGGCIVVADLINGEYHRAVTTSVVVMFVVAFETVINKIEAIEKRLDETN